MGIGIIDVLAIPMLVILIMYVVGTVLDTFYRCETKKYFNVHAVQSNAMKFILGGIVIIVAASIYAGATIDKASDITEDMLVVQLARAGLYLAIASSWYWLYESYSKGYMKTWFSKIKIT